jgi:hypothetical protein
MIGAADIGTCMNDNGDFDELAGITPRAVSELFRCFFYFYIFLFIVFN